MRHPLSTVFFKQYQFNLVKCIHLGLRDSADDSTKKTQICLFAFVGSSCTKTIASWSHVTSVDGWSNYMDIRLHQKDGIIRLPHPIVWIFVSLFFDHKKEISRFLGVFSQFAGALLFKWLGALKHVLFALNEDEV